jgi:uncharacterized protein (TIGR03546 family)
MMFGLGQVIGLIKLLNSSKGEWAIAAGLALGMVLGLVPANPLIVAALFFIFFLFRIHGGSLFLSWALFKLAAYPFDPLFDRFGFRLLTLPSLHDFWTRLYNLPVAPWSNFNNTVVCGSLAAGFLLFVPCLFLFRWLIKRYRASVLKRVGEWKIVKWWQATSLYKMYEKYEAVKGAF